MIRIALICFSFLLCVWANCQTPTYLQYTVRDGLPSAMIYCVAQDKKGFIWIGTDKGLARFDGTRFKTYGVKDGLPDNEVLELFVDSQDRIWLSCFRSKPCFIKDGAIHTSENDPMLDDITLNTGTYDFSEDENGTVWISGLTIEFCRVAQKNLVCGLPSQNGGLNTQIGSIRLIDNIGSHVFAFDNSQIIRLSSKDASVMSVFGTVPISEGPKQRITSITISKNSVLFSRQNKLDIWEYDGHTFHKKDELKGDYNGRALKDRAGRFWFCNRKDGAVCFNNNDQSFDNPVHFLLGKKINNLFEDAEGTLWFSTVNEGLFLLPKGAATSYTRVDQPVFESDNFLSISKLIDGSIALGDDMGNLYKLRGSKFEKTNLDASSSFNRVLQIVPMANNGWIAVTDKKVYSSEGVWGNIWEKEGAPKAILYNDGEFWLGTSNFLIHTPKGSSESIRVKPDRITSLCLDEQSNVWAGGLDGIFSQKDDYKKDWGKIFKPIAGRVTDLEMDDDGALWMANTANGLLKLTIKDGGVKQVQVINDSLTTPIDNVQALYPAKDGVVWLATNTGVYSVDQNFRVEHYDYKNGFVDNNVNAILIDNDTLWAATTAGMTRLIIRQGNISDQAKTKIVGVVYTIGDKKKQFDIACKIGDSNEVTLPPNAAMLEVEFARLSYQTRGNQSYVIETSNELLPFLYLTFKNLFNGVNGYFGNKQTVETVDGSIRNYGVNLAAGRYHVKVAALLANGLKSKNHDSITITVLPYWWQTIWFLLTLLTISAVIVFRMVRARENLLKIKNRNSELQLQAMRAQMNPHFVGNSINAIQQFFYPPDPVKASEYISMFSDLLRRTMHFSETDFISFDDELNYVRDYLEMIRLRFGDRFEYEIVGIDKLVGETPFPAMFLQPILENATLHGLAPQGKSKLHIGFNLENGIVTCEIIDNGVGITAAKAMKARRPQNRVSKGLHLLSQKAKTLNLLYPLNLQYSIEDISSLEGETGTKASISFKRLASLPKTLNQDPTQ